MSEDTGEEDDGWRDIAKIDEDSEQMERRREVWDEDSEEDQERVERVNEQNREAAVDDTDYETADEYNAEKVGAKKAASNLKNWIQNKF